jgi:aryl-phospho-beta-D-glucosidase BglC (GH1 family)
MSTTLRHLLVILALACGWAGAAAAAADSPGHLAVRGPDIVDPSGHPILLRGWNWGHFGKAVESDAADNAAQGANAVRLPLRWWGYYIQKGIDSRDDAATATGGLSPTLLKKLDDDVRWASNAHLWIILFIDSNCGQRGMQNDENVAYCDPGKQYPGGHNFWSDPAARARFIQVWRFIANRYKDTPYLGLFEPLPEPGTPSTTPPEIKDFYGEVMAAIRQVAPGIPFLIGANKYHTALAQSVWNPAWKDVVYTGNLFYRARGEDGGLPNFRRRMGQLAELRSKHGVPIFVQQVGVRVEDDPDASNVKAVLQELVDNRIGFAYWEYRGSNHPGEYGVLYQSPGQGWKTNQATLAAVSAAFRR